MTAPPDWHAADQAYLDHHGRCPICQAAGKNPDLQRCAEGLALWEQYNQAGEPPHFLWLRRQPVRTRA